jgi:DNA polymerase III subunit epsilon
MYLFFDTETTGLPKNWKAPISDSDNWPRLVQLSWAWFDSHGIKWDVHDYIIYPQGFVIPKESSDIHRITQEIAEKEGKELDKILDIFTKDVLRAKHVVAHNIDFDEKIVGAELFRLGLKDVFLDLSKICTMKGSVDVCKIPGYRGNYKYPNLSELHHFLFKEKFDDAHNALADVLATARCFFALRKQGLFK